jgi:hypothetical protein
MAKLPNSAVTTDTSFYFDTEHNNFNNTEHNNIQHKYIMPMAFSMTFRTVTMGIKALIITTLSILAFITMTLSIVTLGKIMTFGIKTLHHRNTQH